MYKLQLFYIYLVILVQYRDSFIVNKTCPKQDPKIFESPKEVDGESSVSEQITLLQSGTPTVELQRDTSPDESSADKIHVSHSHRTV